jgi:hypothetical protein
MAYVGNPIDTKNTFQSLAGKRFNGDGSTTDFTLDVAPGSTLDIEVFVANVRQDPNSAYTLSGTTLSFSAAPASGTNNIYVVHQAKSVGTIDPPANSVGVTQLNLSDGSNGQFIKTDGSGTLSFASVSSALDDITTGDAAATLATSAGDITIDAQGNDTDIIFKGTDGGSDTTFWKMDGSEKGSLLPGSTTTGIYLGVTSATASNLLDDYEEGEFDNCLSINGTTQTSYSSGRSALKYVKIGSFVHLSGLVDTDGQTLGDTGLIRVRLPFAVASSGSSSNNSSKAHSNIYNGTAIYPGHFYISENDTACPFNKWDSSGSELIDGSQIQVGSTSSRVFMFLDVTYKTDA